ncbi:MAG: tetratricopeptide repeat protein [Thermodesulfobacteriota bacterium]|nr:tetratricopeptide repeat protein [Thermodesulfobacteriota bacterium]
MKISERMCLSVLILLLTIALGCSGAWGEFGKASALDHHVKGLRYQEKGKWDKAIAEYTKAIELNPEYGRAYLDRGGAYLNKGQYDQAIFDSTKAIALHPNVSEAYFNRADAYRITAQYDRAISDYTKVIELNPEYAKAYLDRGGAYLCKGDYEQAISDSTKAIELHPNVSEAHFNRAVAYRITAQYDRAISDYTKAIELNPECAEAYVDRGAAHLYMGHYAEAISDSTKAIELNPGYVGGYNNLSWLLATCPDSTYRNGARAVDLAQTAIRLDHSFARLDTLAAAYAEAGRFDEAVKTQEQAITFLNKVPHTEEAMEGYIRRLESYRSGNPWRDKER